MKNLLLSAFVAVLSFSSCADNSVEPTEPVTDAALLAEALETSGMVWYKSDASIFPSSSATDHTPFFRVRFNQTAASVLGSDGKLPAGMTFPEGSLVVKELYRTQPGDLALVAVMKKSAGDPQQKEGWLWAEYYVDGRVLIPVAGKGAVCVACHSVNDRDYIRLFDLF